MKIFKLGIFFIFFLFITFCNLSNSKVVFASRTFYAQIPKDTQVYLYSSSVKSKEFQLFIIPPTYFVELIKNADDFFYARYNDIYGYVLKNEVKPVNNVPTSPFLTNINFRVFVPSGANLRSTPYNNGTVNLIYSIPFLDSNLLYYGVSLGEEAISKKGNVWYYCKYFAGNLTYTGYVYAPLCDYLSPIIENTETVEYIDNVTFDDDAMSTQGQVFKGLSQTTTTIIIIAISLPCLLFIYLLFKPTRIAEETTSSDTKNRKKYQKKKIKRLKNSDYFELDDDF